MCSYMSLPDEFGGDMLDLDLGQLSMDFDADLMNDPLLTAALPDVPQAPASLFWGSDLMNCDATLGSAFEQGELRARPPKSASNRLERTRERNRLAQARYRERQKQELAETKAKVTTAESSIVEAMARLDEAKLANEKLVRRAAEAASSLLAIISPSGKQKQTTSQTTASSSHTGQPLSEAVPVAPWPSAASKPAQPPTLPSAHAPTSPITSENAATPTSSAHTADTNARSASASDCSHTEVTTTSPAFTMPPMPPPMVDQPLDVGLPKQPPLPPTAHRAPLHPASLFSDPFPSLRSGTRAAHSPPQWPWAVSNPSTSNRIDLPPAGASDTEEDSEEVQMVEAVIVEAAERLRAQRHSVAVAAGVDDGDVHWFLQFPYSVTPSHSTGGGSGAARSAQRAKPETATMSCSAAIVSRSCMTSLFTFFICSRLEGACLAAALDTPTAAEHKSRAATAATTYHTLSKLETILSRCDDAACAAPLHGTCGTAGRFVMSEGVSGIIHGIAARYRPSTAPAAWAGACADFVDFMFSKHQPKGADFKCPLTGRFDEEEPGDRARGASGDGEGGVHVAARCPKCAVVMHVTRALRDVISEGEQLPPGSPGAAGSAEGSAQQELWQRAAEMSSCFALVVSQCLVDAPHLMRHLRVLSTSPPGLLQTQADKMGLELYRALRLTPAQHSVVSAVWSLWLRRRRELSRRFRAALSGLANLVSTSDLPLHELQTLRTAPHACSDTTLACCEPVPHAADTCAAHDVHAARDNGPCDDPSHTCARCAQRTPWQLRMMGAGGAAEAAAALQRLCRVHTEDSTMLADTARVLCLPDVLFTTPQLVTQLPVSLKFGLPMVDWLQLCRFAVRERDHNGLLQTFA
eukprot:jgi/Ulvmu1/10933/UM007_0112.1